MGQPLSHSPNSIAACELKRSEKEDAKLELLRRYSHPCGTVPLLWEEVCHDELPICVRASLGHPEKYDKSIVAGTLGGRTYLKHEA